ncbi:hypothetical protein CCACVL1_12853 [Corchorus capsularis]|uniref:Uncharacterized protein n=1 Tax=Corchorus capsularis TaxID=210143 RepID=A0A1R3IDG8_COCAP|nr:hypothetical protein CCACVL1_12853 [Corchorus capsularis]
MLISRVLCRASRKLLAIEPRTPKQLPNYLHSLCGSSYKVSAKSECPMLMYMQRATFSSSPLGKSKVWNTSSQFPKSNRGKALDSMKTYRQACEDRFKVFKLEFEEARTAVEENLRELFLILCAYYVAYIAGVTGAFLLWLCLCD